MEQISKIKIDLYNNYILLKKNIRNEAAQQGKYTALKALWANMHRLYIYDLGSKSAKQ